MMGSEMMFPRGPLELEKLRACWDGRVEEEEDG